MDIHRTTSMPELNHQCTTPQGTRRSISSMSMPGRSMGDVTSQTDSCVVSPTSHTSPSFLGALPLPKTASLNAAPLVCYAQDPDKDSDSNEALDVASRPYAAAWQHVFPDQESLYSSLTRSVHKLDFRQSSLEMGANRSAQSNMILGVQSPSQRRHRSFDCPGHRVRSFDVDNRMNSQSPPPQHPFSPRISCLRPRSFDFIGRPKLWPDVLDTTKPCGVSSAGGRVLALAAPQSASLRHDTTTDLRHQDCSDASNTVASGEGDSQISWQSSISRPNSPDPTVRLTRMLSANQYETYLRYSN
jgi:hypothetical protein